MRIAAPIRVSRTYVQHLAAPVRDVFPLLCPVREAEWIEGWDPRVVYTTSGVCEEGCVFVTDSDGEEAVWTVVEHVPDRGRIEFLRVTPGVTSTRIAIRVSPEGPASCTAEITYGHTALGPLGERIVADFTEDRYRAFMEAWEDRLNHYLRTGTMLEEEA